MSRRVLLVVRDFALDPYRAESRFQSAANRAGQFGNSEDLCGSLEKIGDEFHKALRLFRGAQAASLHSSAACRRNRVRQAAEHRRQAACAPRRRLFRRDAESPSRTGVTRETRALPRIIARAIILRTTHAAPRSAVSAQSCDTLSALPRGPAGCA